MKGLLFRCVAVLGFLSSAAFGSGATRNLPDSIVPGASFTVTITLDTPPGTSVAAAEDAPPAGWTVSNISNSGTLDLQTGKVKWGLFFAPSIPTTLSYDVTATASSSRCFSGTVSFDGAGSGITGDSCLNVIPASSTWGVLALIISLLTAGTIVANRQQ
jgi:hypothetical protein